MRRLVLSPLLALAAMATAGSKAPPPERIAFGPVRQIKPQAAIGLERAIEIAHADTDVIDTFDRDRLVHGDRLATSVFSQKEPRTLDLMSRPADRCALAQHRDRQDRDQ